MQSLKITKSCKQDGESLLNILKHSIAMVRILLTFIDGSLAFSNNSSYVLSYSSYINHKVLSRIFFSNLEVLLLLQKCHAKGQKLKLDKMKV